MGRELHTAGSGHLRFRRALRIPGATYRLQVNADFTLADVQKVIPYLRDLGISDLYISPIYEARAGSSHGYDVTRPDRINPEVGTLEELRELSAAARAHGMGVLLDIVPNHMAAFETNPWWRDVVENGRASAFAGFFDVDWQSDPPGEGRLLLPVLGQPLDAAIEAGEVRAAVKDGLPVLLYYDRDFPLDPGSYAQFFELLNVHDADLRSVLDSVPHRDDMHRRGERAQNAAAAKEAARGWFQRNGTPEDIRIAPSDLKRLHDTQAFSLWYWVRGTRRINYRRFFDISDLAGLRVEDEPVFDAVHSLTLPLLADGTLTGLRIDHIDGLRDPRAYLERLRGRTDNAYVLVEKILIGDEQLPVDWDTEGTTGYDFIGVLNNVFIDGRGYERIRDWYESTVGGPNFEQLVVDRKRQVIEMLFDGEVRDLTAAFVGLGARMGVTLQSPDAQEAIASLTAALPVYRTYITEGGIPDEARTQLLAARSKITAPAESLDLLTRMLLGDVPQEHKTAVADFTMRWQQFTGPVMAKGLEDTAFYNWNVLISLCEVGTYPPAAHFSTDAFHEFMERRREVWPHAMNASSTHDTKRSEDVRARINVLSELSDEWITFVERCTVQFDALRPMVEDVPVPDRNEQILLYQTILGAWPLDGHVDDTFRERIRAFMLKAMREAKTHTSWSSINEPYEHGVLAFCDALLTSDAFAACSRALRDRMAVCGALNSLSLVVMKLGAPGVPDIYQGTETYGLALVDPDNRRPVDYDTRRALLADTRPIRDKLESWQNGAIKTAVTRAGLALRDAQPELFRDGVYQRLSATGPRRDHVIAFARVLEGRAAVFVAGRWFARLCEGGVPPGASVWEDTLLELPPLDGVWRNVLTNETIAAGPATGPADQTGASAALETGARAATNSIAHYTVPLAGIFSQLPCAMLVLER